MWDLQNLVRKGKKSEADNMIRGGKKHAFTHSYFKALPPHGIWEGSV
jgi:hypothetical protein